MVDWLNLSQTSGSGYALISVTASPNTGSPRSTSLVVSGHTTSVNIDVEQVSGTPIVNWYIYGNPDSISAPYQGGVYDVTIATNGDWSVSPVSWASVSPSSGTSGVSTVQLTIGENTGTTSRIGVVTFTNHTSTYELDLTQMYSPINEYFTMLIESDGTIGLTNASIGSTPNVSYSKNNGSWNRLYGGRYINVSAGDEVRFKSTATTWGLAQFTGTSRMSVYGNIMSLTYGDNFQGKYTLKSSSTGNTFSHLLSNMDVTHAGSLILPATALTDFCYAGMFDGCIPLQTAPSLPATSLAESCYVNMFYWCHSLRTPPELPATTLAVQCYFGMFEECISLQTAPVLSATTLASNCYTRIFKNCSQIDTVYCYAVGNYSSVYTGDWLYGTSSAGTLYKMSGTTLADIPSGWTVVNI